MKTLLVASALLALCLVPLAHARPDVPEPPVTVGPCTVSWSHFWPGETVGARCDAAGTPVGASHGTCSLGHYVTVRAGGTTLHQPCNMWHF